MVCSDEVKGMKNMTFLKILRIRMPCRKETVTHLNENSSPTKQLDLLQFLL
jgi:hypothetical protein